MIKTKHLLLFILILAFGLIIEGLKSMKGLNTNRSGRISSFTLRDQDAKPFYITDSDKNADRKRLMAEGHSARGGFKLSTTANLNNKNILKSDLTIAKNENTATAAAKKKKKKKHARGKGKINSNENDLKAKLYPESESEKLNDSELSQTKKFESQFSAPTKKDDTLPISYEDWAQLILGSPRPENVAKLVDFYSNNMVSGDVFYAILSALLEESNPEQHKLAVYAAGNVPNAQSFSFLVHVLKTEDQGSQSAVKANEQIMGYQTLHSVVQLKAVLSLQISDINIVQMALNVLDKSTQQFLENRNPTAEDTASSTAGATAASNTNVTKAYNGFEPILQQVIETYKGQTNITEPAERSLTRIKKLSVVVADLNS